MVTLFLDIGNSLIKAAIDDEQGYRYQGSISLEEFIDSKRLDRFFDSVVPDSIYISAVASPETIDTIKSTLQAQYQLFAMTLSSQKACCGLSSGYDDFHQLGDDRWMALQGAHSLSIQPVIVVDAGTAMTIDAILDGQHLGGFIVPGLTSLRGCLASDTAIKTVVDGSVVLDADKIEHTLLATNTSDAILAGTLYMSSAFINRLILDLNQQLETSFQVMITGGNAAKLSSLIDVPSDYIPDLVLLGMKRIVESVKK